MLQVALSKIEFGKFKYTGGGANTTGFAGIGIAVLALAASLKILENLNPGLALRNVGVLGLLMAELGLVTSLMSVISPKMFTGGVSLLLFSGAVALIFKALEDVRTKDTGEVPMHIRNAPVKQMESLGYHQGYLYPHDFPGHYVEQQYLPDKMVGTKYYIKDENCE